MNVYETRREKLYTWMAAESVSLLTIEDREGARDPALRYLTGFTSDAILFLCVDKRAILVAWDHNLAKLTASVEVILPFSDYERQPVKAVQGIAHQLKVSPGARIEIPSTTPYPEFLRYVEALRDFDVLCRTDGAGEIITGMRALKDEEEMAIYRKGAAITNEVIALLEKELSAGTLTTELDVALFIEAEARSRGCEGTGFETLAAGSARSFCIHAVPAYTSSPFADKGLSILDFGLKYKGYTTDVTMTVAKGELEAAQTKMLNLVEKAYAQALALVAEGLPTREIALIVDALFAKGKKSMPHALGHGIGLEAHEAPALRSRADNTWKLERGMVFTLEPGLYDIKHGGCRLENDIMITDTGVEILTCARILRL